jgi:hypothetical protein
MNIYYIYIYKFLKIFKFKCNKVAILIILVFVPQAPILEMVPEKLFCGCLIRGEKDWKNQNKTKLHKTKKTPQNVLSSNAIQFQ